MNLIRSIALPLLPMFRWLAEYFGIRLLSTKRFQQIISMRRLAVEELVDLERAELNPGLSCIIFSKDRALQLYTLLYTYFKHVKNPSPIFVIYDTSSEDHSLAYEEVKLKFTDKEVPVTFCLEIGSFRETLLKVLSKIYSNSIFFLVDDIIFISPVNLGIISEIEPTSAILSLRHSPHLKRSYTMNVAQEPPALSRTTISPDLLIFNWFEKGNEWSDPWSVDGQILSTAEIRVLTRISEFQGPNSYESALKTFNDLIKSRMGLCFKESKILNLPINRVQKENNNLSGNITPEFLLEQWKKGLMIDIDIFDGYIPSSPHEVHELSFKQRL